MLRRSMLAQGTAAQRAGARRSQPSMPLQGVGTDLLFLPRLAGLVRRRSEERLASRILSIQEHTRWQSLPASQRLSFLAVRWSVKEAAYKSLQPDFRLTWKDLSFLDNSASGSPKPVLAVTGIRSGILLHASVSHDGDHVIAMVVAELDPMQA